MANHVTYAHACAHYQKLILDENDLKRQVEQARGTLELFTKRLDEAEVRRRLYEDVLKESACSHIRTLTSST